MPIKKNKNRVLIRTSWISTIGNAILSIAKIIIGLLSGSLAVISDGIDSAADVVISIAMIFTARIMNQPPNRKYVYGYEKAEGIATKLLSMVIFFAGMQMLISSGKSLLLGEIREMPGMIAVYVTVISIVGKLLLSAYQFRQGRKVESSLLIANARNMRNDVV
ncbi:cation diffusion facilitator family transporter, partial [Bacteroides sp. OttesenSCG-928-F21]|nr:cation diffusion facilitator family transporter [Bacteroides sp. OttesenSCG-928-F21]